MKRRRQLKERIQEKLSQLTIARLRQMPQEVRGQWEELLQTDATPGSVAGAFAAGTFISTLPVPMLELVVFLVVSRVVPKPKRLPMIAAQTMWNTLTMAPLYLLSPKIGHAVVEAASTRGVISAAPANGGWLVGVVAGNLVLGLLLTAASYVIVRLGYAYCLAQRN
jgi:uncharacterized protein (DUF2062 family)